MLPTQTARQLAQQLRDSSPRLAPVRVTLVRPRAIACIREHPRQGLKRQLQKPTRSKCDSLLAVTPYDCCC